MPITLPKVNPPTETHLALLVDSSGSMAGLGEQVVKNVNSILEGLQKKAKELNQSVIVSIYSFGGRVDTLISKQPIELSPRLSPSDYRADGGTPMYDALATAVSDLLSIDKPTVANLVTVITDGQENGSGVYVGAINSEIAKLTGTDRWTFSFLIPNGHTSEITRRLQAVMPGNIQEWETTGRGLNAGSQALSNGYASYLNLRSVGGMKTNGFFTAAVNPTQAKQAKAKLDDVRSDFKALTVRTQDPKSIQDFVEARGLQFQKGKAFYQLSKTETVQPTKEVLLKEIATGALYGGAQARQILGLPTAGDIKVKPADYSDWDIFVQSMSNNRKLVVGTNLLYLR